MTAEPRGADSSLLARATQRAGLVESASAALHGRYRFTLTGADCRADVGDDDGGIREMTTGCVLLSPAPPPTEER